MKAQHSASSEATANPKKPSKWAKKRKRKAHFRRENVRAAECSPMKKTRHQSDQQLDSPAKNTRSSTQAHGCAPPVVVRPPFDATPGLNEDSLHLNDGYDEGRVAAAESRDVVLHLTAAHTNSETEVTYGGKFVFPPGCHSFVDGFDPKYTSHHVTRVPQGKRVIGHGVPKVDPKCEGQQPAASEEATLYWVEGCALQSEIQGLDVTAEGKGISHMRECMSTNMAAGEYRGVGGMGEVYHCGRRYRYSEKRNSKKQKLDSWALHPDANPKRHESALKHVQKVSNAAVRRVEQWDSTWEGHMVKQRAMLDKVLAESGTASFTFPSASLGFNGGYSTHKDKRDIRWTVWVCMRKGALVFPEYQHIVHLHPGDVIAFNGREQWHAQMVTPTRSQLVKHVLQRTYIRDTDHLRQTIREVNNQQIPEVRPMVVCLYWQRQQRGYLVNRYNRRQEAGEEIQLSSEEGELASDEEDWECEGSCNEDMHAD